MKQEHPMVVDYSIAIRLWLYISRPFQITKVLELLYMLDWLWYACLSFVPSSYIAGSLFISIRQVLQPYQISAIFAIIAIFHIVGLYRNIIWLRKFNLVFNIAILFYLTAIVLQKLPIAAGVGYYVILVGISIFAFWRMDETH